MGLFLPGRHFYLRPVVAFSVLAGGLFNLGHAAPVCGDVMGASPAVQPSAYYQDVAAVMKMGPYDPEHLPVIPLQMFRLMGGKKSFFVAERSREILVDHQDYRAVGQPKPIHPMGVGLTGDLEMIPTRWSGLFRGGKFPVIVRASISQGNPFKFEKNGQMQVRSTAMAIKVFPSADLKTDLPTANAVFQNNLNGLLGADGRPLNYLESPQTNQPGLDVSKITQLYQVETLLGVAYGAIVNPKDHMSKVPFINPHIRPVHSWAEFGEKNPQAVNVPVWVKIEPRLKRAPVSESDFRLEIWKTLKRDGVIEYALFTADRQDEHGQIQWEPVGTLRMTTAYLSSGVDQNLLFPHNSFNSLFTGRKFQIPDPEKQLNSPPEDLQ